MTREEFRKWLFDNNGWMGSLATDAAIDELLEPYDLQLLMARHIAQRVHFSRIVDQVRHGELPAAEVGPMMRKAMADYDGELIKAAAGVYEREGLEAKRDHDFVAEFERLKG